MSPFGSACVHAAFLGTFLRFMAVSLKRGVPVVEFLEHFRATQRMPGRCSRAMTEVTEMVKRGERISDSLSGFPDIFPGWLVAGVKAGERGAHLDQVAQRMASLQSRRCHILRLVERDWAYPLFLSGAIVTLVIALGVLTMPDFLRSASEAARSNPTFGHEYPWLTMALGLLSSAMAAGWLVGALVLAIAVAFLGRRLAAKTRWGERLGLGWRALKQRIPYYGRAQRQLALAGFCDSVSDLLQHGVALHEALEMGAESVPDDELRLAMAEVARRVRAGTAMATALGAVPALPHMFLFKIELGLGEQLLAGSFQELGDSCREDAQAVLQRAQAVLQPLLIVVMGGLVAAIWFLVFYFLFGVLGVLQEG